MLGLVPMRTRRFALVCMNLPGFTYMDILSGPVARRGKSDTALSRLQ